MKAFPTAVLAFLLPWLAPEAAAQAAPHFELEIALSMGGAERLSGSAIVEAGKHARFSLLEPDGRSGSRVDLVVRGVETDARGRSFAMADARVYEKNGGEWILRAEPRIFPLLGATAHAKLGADEGASRESLDLQVKVTAVGR